MKSPVRFHNHVYFMGVQVSVLLFLGSCLPSGLAWTQQSLCHPSVRSRALNLKHLNNEEDSSHLEEALGGGTSRRQWLLSGMASVSASAMVSAGYLLPARAADLISTDAVCDPGVSVWKRNNRYIYLLGTAHISSASAKLAGDLVKDVHPNGVFVELDAKRITGSGLLAGRLQGGGGGTEGDVPTSRVIIPNIQMIPLSPTLLSDSTTSSTTISPSSITTTTSTTSSSNVPVPTTAAATTVTNPIMRAASRAVGNSIKSMYKKLDSAGFQAGEEFVVAIREAQAIGSDIVLGDRDVEVTLRRLTEGLAQTDLKALMNPDSELEQSLKELVPSKVASSSSSSSRVGDIGDLSDEEFREEFSSFVETMKAKENVRKVMGQLERLAPALYEALVSERDAYMAAGLNGLDELETIVAVMGVAHVDGVERNLAMNGWKAVQPNCARTK